MVRRWGLLLTAALLSMLVSACSLYAAFREVGELQTQLEDAGFSNPKVNISVDVENDVTTRTITAAVDRPRNAEFDQKVATEVANLVIMNYSQVDELDMLTVELSGSGTAAKFSLKPSEWRDLARDFREPPGIASAVLARDVRGDDFEAVDPTSDFPADQSIFHAVVAVRNLPADTTVKAVWTAIDTGGAAPPNTEIVANDVKAEGSRRLHFTMEPNAGKLPPGSYKLDLFWADNLDRTVPFTVAGG